MLLTYSGRIPFHSCSGYDVNVSDTCDYLSWVLPLELGQNQFTLLLDNDTYSTVRASLTVSTHLHIPALHLHLHARTD